MLGGYRSLDAVSDDDGDSFVAIVVTAACRGQGTNLLIRGGLGTAPVVVAVAVAVAVAGEI